MSEIWDKDSTIEEKYSNYLTPELSQLKVRFNVRRIYQIINKYRNYGTINEDEYHKLLDFIDGEYAEQFSELVVYVKELFGDKLKNRYFRYELEKKKKIIVKENIAFNQHYQRFMDYFLKENIPNLNLLKESTHYVMQKIPEAFKSSMLSKEYKEKIEKILPGMELAEREQQEIDNISKYAGSDNAEYLYEKKLLDTNFKQEIMSDIPDGYSDLEKSIYIYIKLCQVLSYDPNFYANESKYKKMHEDFNNLSKIGVETKNVVCYEFVSIYSEILKDMGIKLKSTLQFELGDDMDEKTITYGGFDNRHAILIYTVDGLAISADSTISVLEGDIINAKVNKPLNGLKCLNLDESKQEEFKSTLDKVYSQLKIENSIYKKYGKEIKEKPLVEKLKLLFDDISDTAFNPTDFISYINSIKHELFTYDELDWNLMISYIGKNKDNEQYPVALFSVNTNDILNVPEDTVQYLYDPKDKEVTKLEKKEIESMFTSKELYFIDGIRKIPNVNLVQNNKAI